MGQMVMQPLLCHEKEPRAGAGEYALPVQDSGQAGLSDLCISIASLPPFLPPSLFPPAPTHSQDPLQVEKCCHVKEPGAVGDLPHLPSVLSKLLSENQNTSCHLLRSSHQVTYRATWGCASASRHALKFQHVLRTAPRRVGGGRQSSGGILLSNLQD